MCLYVDNNVTFNKNNKPNTPIENDKNDISVAVDAEPKAVDGYRLEWAMWKNWTKMRGAVRPSRRGQGS